MNIDKSKKEEDYVGLSPTDPQIWKKLVFLLKGIVQ